MQIVSWNVNGIRACVKKGFLTYLSDYEPDIVCVQETKVRYADIPEEILNPLSYHGLWHTAEKPGYSGVAIFTRKKPISIVQGIGIEKYDREGRVIMAEYDNFYLFNVYFPNGKASEERLAYKGDFYADFFNYCATLTDKPHIICGDYNTAHTEIDLARPKENEKVSGFLPIERTWLDNAFNQGYTDSFRQFINTPDHYSWWSYRAGARQRNVGWRIDYVLTSAALVPQLKDAFIQPEVMGSDHCPVGITLTHGAQ